ncbi:MAG: GEVED domain-containing protein, partial [Planctomycetota bacterium]
DRILDGRYQLEIRQGPSYGITPGLTAPEYIIGDDFDTNEPLENSAVLTATDGANITNGQTFTLGSTTFEFIDVAMFEDNSTIPGAYLTELSPGTSDTYIGIATIGDNRNGLGDNNIEEQGLDVDFIAFDLQAGDVLAVDIDSANPDNISERPSQLDTHLRVFDSSGNLITFNSSTPAPGDRTGDAEFLDPSLVFTARTTETYYVAVSFEGNENYNPFVAGSGTIPPTSFLLESGGGTYRVTAKLNGGELQSGNIPVYFSPSDSDGEIANRIVAAVNGVSGLNANVARRGISNILDVFGDAKVATSGFGQSPESNDTISTATPTDIRPGVASTFKINGTLGDNFEFTEDLGKDVDIFQVSLAAGEKLTIDVDGLSIGSGIDSTIQIFDSSGTSFGTFEDDSTYDFLTDWVFDPRRPDNANSLEGDLVIDPFAVFAAPFTGDYFIAISGSSNVTYDPLVAGSGRSFFGSDKGRYEITLTSGDGGLGSVNTTGVGQDNLERNQGQLLISSSQIRFSQNHGVVVVGADAIPMALRNLVSSSSTPLVPGITVVNNVIARNGKGGIIFAGTETEAGEQPAPVPFGRIVNNTIVGISNSAGFVGTGIEVRDNAGPTLLNNIIAENEIGITVEADTSALETVNVATLYKENDIDVQGIGVGDFAILLRDVDPLFVNSENDNFVPAEGSLAIDSSVDSLPDRDAMIAARASLGIPVSPILVPDTDVTGQLRIDDPNVNTPDGQGANVFSDRGAIDAADKAGPIAQLTTPTDNGANDGDPADGTVVTAELLTRFEIRLFDTSASGFDTGIGVDDTTVTPDAISITQDGVLLELGTDYRFGYDAASNLIRLTPLSGVWSSNATYQITLDNTMIADLAGNVLRPNQLDGTTRLIITAGLGRDFGDAPSNYPVLEADGGASHGLIEGFYLGNGVTSESDGKPSSNGLADGFDDGVAIPDQLVRGGVSQFTVTASQEGRLSAWIDWNNDGDWTDPGEQIFGGTVVATGANLLGPISVPIDVASDIVNARFRLSSVGGLAPTGPAPDGEVEDYQINIASNPWQNTNAGSGGFEDVNNDGIVSPIDALLIINELNNPQVSDPNNGALSLDEDDLPGENGPFLDVNGDGFVSPIDALLVINRLNNPAPAAPLSSGFDVGQDEDEEETDSPFWSFDDDLDDLANDVTSAWGQDD